MYELACPSCNSASQYDLDDFLLLCPFCSTTFTLDRETGQKDIFQDHFIIANTATAAQTKEYVLEWLRRIHHNPAQTDKEHFIADLHGISIPFWVVSMEVHSLWKGLVKKQRRTPGASATGSDYLIEKGQFQRNYRWCVSGRHNLCEVWGMTRLHEPQDEAPVAWDGFPLDSTLSRGRLEEEAANEKSPYDAREFFEFKFSNGLPILGVQVDDKEALRRAQRHVEQYHWELARQQVDYLVDFQSEIEIAGVQLIHIPFWHARYIYRPRTFLRHFYRPRERNVILEGYKGGVLKGEVAVQRQDKMWINAGVCAVAAVFMLFLGLVWHPAFYLVSLFGALVAGASAYLATVRAEQRRKGLPVDENAETPADSEGQPLEGVS